jgi:hypothetical protein
MGVKGELPLDVTGPLRNSSVDRRVHRDRLGIICWRWEEGKAPWLCATRFDRKQSLQIRLMFRDGVKREMQ